MPIFEGVTVKAAEVVWKSPDGQRVLQKVTFNVAGQDMVAKTYSSDIPVVDWSGDIETYEKEGKFGSETYVRQAPKEGGFGGGSSSSAGTASPGTSGSRGNSQASKFDNFTMYLSYAKDLAVASIVDGKLDDELYSRLLEAVSAGGEQLYDTRPGAEPKVDPGAITMDEVNAVFGEGESSWNRNS